MLEQMLLSNLNNKAELDDESFEYKSIFLSSVVPDPTNGRFLPSICIDDEDARLFVARKLSKAQLTKLYQGENHVLIGKSIIINCLEHGSEDWKRASQTIGSIIELGDNISVSEMIQAPTLYPIEDGRFQILTGHRRFFALVYAKGYGAAAQFKVYDSKPLLTKVKQFQENASREDLPQYGKLQAFSNAVTEIEQLNKARLQSGLSRLTVREVVPKLGISMGAYDNYKVLSRYPVVMSAYERGCSYSFIKMKRLILSLESQYKEAHNKLTLNAMDKRAVSELIEQQLQRIKKQPAKSKPPFITTSFGSHTALQRLLTQDVTQLACGVDWPTLDWQDKKAVSEALERVIAHLEQES
ncbi:hypothetical protein CWB99_05425 [Pseudoalteromonas rubra]|uniref:ParB/Sulfiredoxin domain-containing protein n=1 Tax=Pseudoalteromonas rubra TaxID=43658 RepID=A0A5S3WQT7_9GAMM|nr:hypothetical protein [Pseudoalteromonas rubra]TMP30777.1 hypothetical protein CWB99_05425 [Pseudoalteromonas rubra]TMP34145.1 hypothetical protein CWC00_08255 [Pseudoalteromonas rubra]